MLKKLLKVGGVDFHVGATIAFRVWSILAGGIMLLCLSAWLSKVEQGYYFAFSSILALQVFFELGLNQVVLQLVSHEMSAVKAAPGGNLSGDAFALARLAAINKLLKRWYGAAAILFVIFVAPVGLFFFSRNQELAMIKWAPVWLALVVATGANLYWSWTLAFNEACGRMGQVARLRLTQSVIGYSLLWLGLAMGFGLVSIVCLPAVGVLVTGIWLHTTQTEQSWINRNLSEYAPVKWKEEIFPFQWRIAISWISGYFIFQLFTPLVFIHQGAIEAGRLGMSLALFNAVISLGMSWVTVKVPTFVRYIAEKDRIKLNEIFKHVTTRAVIFVFGLSLLLLLFVAVLSYLNVPFVGRLASLPALSCLAVITVVNTFIFSAATYMRAHKEEPMLPASVAMAVMALLCAYFGSSISIIATTGFYALATVAVSLPWTIILLRRYYYR